MVPILSLAKGIDSVDELLDIASLSLELPEFIGEVGLVIESGDDTEPEFICGCGCGCSCGCC